jgi:hypothetical protein
LAGAPGRWRTWFRRWQWAARAIAWDEWLQALAEQAHADAIREATRRHLDSARALQDLGLRRLKLDAAAPPGEPKALKPMEAEAATQAVAQGIALERLALGLPTTVARTEYEVTERIRTAARLVERVTALVKEHLCPTCRAAVLAEIERLSREAEALKQADGGV